MLEKNNKRMFYVLLSPLYILMLIFVPLILEECIGPLAYVLFIVIASWSLSREKSLIINTIGMIIFIAFGVLLIYSAFSQTTRIGPWNIGIYLAGIHILIGVIGFIYDIIKLICNQK